jgi:hypothetical protein
MGSICARCRRFAPAAGNTPGIGGRLPTYRFMTRKSAMIAAWLVVML